MSSDHVELLDLYAHRRVEAIHGISTYEVLREVALMSPRWSRTGAEGADERMSDSAHVIPPAHTSAATNHSISFRSPMSASAAYLAFCCDKYETVFSRRAGRHHLTLHGAHSPGRSAKPSLSQLSSRPPGALLHPPCTARDPSLLLASTTVFVPGRIWDYFWTSANSATGCFKGQTQ